MRAPNRPANVTLNIPEVYWSFSSWSHRRRGGIGYEADACTGVWRLPRHCSGTEFGNGGFIPRGMKLGSKRSTRKEIQEAEDQSRGLEARPFARPKLVGVERECALGEAAVFRHGASLGTGLRPDALDRT